MSVLVVWAFVLDHLIRGDASPTLTRFLPFSAVEGLVGPRSAGNTDATIAAALTRTQDAVLFVGSVATALTTAAGPYRMMAGPAAHAPAVSCCSPLGRVASLGVGDGGRSSAPSARRLG